MTQADSQTNKPAFDADAFADRMIADLPTMSRANRAELAMTIAIAGIAKTPSLEPSQKADIVNAGLHYLRLTTLYEFLSEIATSESGRKCGLILDPGEEAAKQLRARIAISLLRFGETQAKANERFRNMMEMLADAK